MVLSTSYAARPLITDDARIVDEKACQLESWVKKNRDGTEYWALPGCNLTGNLELSLGGARTNNASGTHTSDTLFQAKTLFRTLEPNSWAWGLAVGHVRRPQIHYGAIGDLYAYVPASFSFKDDKLLVHSNVGWLREKESKEHRATWGLATETQVSKATWLIAETYGQNKGNPYFQVGIRHWLVQNFVQLDMTYGKQAGSDSRERWFTVGIRLLPPPFLP
jgi:hypothetical protein